MKKILILVLSFISAIVLYAQDDFANAKWIAMEADSTILFPYVHLLPEESGMSRSLKEYHSPILAKYFTIKRKVKRAWVDICGLGQYELFINKQKVGDHFLDPGWTLYNKELMYNEFDVTEIVQNAVWGQLDVKVVLSGGMYDIPVRGYHKMAGSCGAPKLLFCLHLEYANGKTHNLVSDESWLAVESPIRYSSIYAGETYDARYEDVVLNEEAMDIVMARDEEIWQETVKMWNTTVTNVKNFFRDVVKLKKTERESYTSKEPIETISSVMPNKVQTLSEPRPVVITKPHWEVPLVKQPKGTFVKIRQELPATAVRSNLYDTHQNCSGIVHIKVKGKRGTSIVLRPSEVLRNGEIYQSVAPGYEWKYILRGDENGEEWQPQFSYTGFRYVDVSLYDSLGNKISPSDDIDDVKLLSLSCLHTTLDTPEVGTFECSDPLLNRIHLLVDWAIRSNMASVITDCPTREKLGWLEQCHLMAPSLMCRYDMLPIMSKIIDDMAASQHPDGCIPTIAPEYVVFEKGSGFEDTPEWGASFVLCPWYLYEWYGDDTSLRKHYDGMKRYLSYLQSRCRDGILDYGLGDWYDLGPNSPGKAQLTSVAFTATAMYYNELVTMSRIAEYLNREADMLYYKQLASSLKDTFIKRFYVGGKNVFENGSQTALAMALCLGLTSSETQQMTVNALARNIMSNGNFITAGDVGYRYVIEALQANAFSDVIYATMHNDSKPGYAWQLNHGATALTESWQAYDNSSNNHLMLGHILEWLYSSVGGIKMQPGTIAWEHILIDPQSIPGISSGKVSLRAIRGIVSSDWRRDDKHFSITFSIPEGSDAIVVLPRPDHTTTHQHFTSGTYSYSY